MGTFTLAFALIFSKYSQKLLLVELMGVFSLKLEGKTLRASLRNKSGAAALRVRIFLEFCPRVRSKNSIFWS